MLKKVVLGAALSLAVLVPNQAVAAGPVVQKPTDQQPNFICRLLPALPCCHNWSPIWG